MSKLRVYIAGPMTGLPQYNYPLFDAVEQALTQAGHSVFNPAAIGRVHGFAKPYGFYLRESLQMMLECNAIAMLPGWKQSRGASLEYTIATALQFLEVQLPGHLATTHGSEAATTTEGNSHDLLSTSFNLPQPDFVNELIAERFNKRSLSDR